MEFPMKRLLPILLASLVATGARADEVGHFSPGVASIRDFSLPDPGFYGVVYNHFYWSGRLNDASGDAIRSVEIGQRRLQTTVDVDIDLKLYALAPVLLWASKFKILGARIGAYVAPTFANSSVGAALATASGRGGEASASTFNVGDMYVQPGWLSWGLKHWDLGLSYGFYAPLGAYETESVDLPIVGPLRVEASDNIGFGYWTHQLQGSSTWYPWEDKRMAVTGAVTYEFHGDKKDFDLKPGQDLSLTWGVSQYLPLVADQTLLAELGFAGYDSWQTTVDHGSAASDRQRDQVHALGAQAGLTYLPWMLVLNVHGFYEYLAKDRFQGGSFGVNLAKKFL
jgi:hypothetical protein